MPQIFTTTHLADLETKMQILAMNEYSALSSNLWVNKVAKFTTSDTRTKVFKWLLETAGIVRGVEGDSRFEKILMAQMKYDQDFAHTGLKLKRSEMEDKDANGVEAAEHWATQIGHYIGYFPQKVVADTIKSNPLCYDGQLFFSTAHPSDPSNASSTPFANVFTGAASGSYPGALPIHAYGAGAVTLDVAVQNIGKAIAYAQTIPMPNGVDPRGLRLSGIVAPPAMQDRLQQITKAQYFGQAATGGAAAANVESVISNWGFGEPIIAAEFSTAFGGLDTDYYLTFQHSITNPLGAVIYDEREPFSITYHTPADSPELARAREYQWLVQGRNTCAVGHPFLMAKGRAT